MITQARLKERLNYNPDTGVFTWKRREELRPTDITWNKRFADKRAGNINKASGYVMMYVDGVNYHAHRLACVYMTGEAPAVTDHVDLDRANNKWTNLRAATHSQNLQNQRVKSNSSNGAKGVYLNKGRLHQAKPWSAQISVSGSRLRLGYFETKEQAAQAYWAAAQKYFGQFARAA